MAWLLRTFERIPVVNNLGNVILSSLSILNLELFTPVRLEHPGRGKGSMQKDMPAHEKAIVSAVIRYFETAPTMRKCKAEDPQSSIINALHRYFVKKSMSVAATK
jgi:hypothetical protein